MGSVIHPLQDTVCRALEQMEWKYEITDEGWVAAGCGGSRPPTTSACAPTRTREIVACYVSAGTLVSEPLRAAAAEAITRANWGLRVGNFEMDYTDGEIRFKVSVDVEGGLLGHTMVQNMISAGISMHDRYHPALMRVGYAGASPADAISDVEH
jgi:hypothetical protein